MWGRRSLHWRAWFGLGVGLGLACGTTDPGGGETNGTTGTATSTATVDETGSTVPAECEVIGSVDGEVNCGYHEECDECIDWGSNAETGVASGGSETGGSETGGSETGGSETGGEGTGGGGTDLCAAENAEVVVCVMQAEADGVPFRFGYHYYANGGMYETLITYQVAVDGTMWRRESDYSDLCWEKKSSVHGVVDFNGCETWECLRSRANGAPRVATCTDEDGCAGS